MEEKITIRAKPSSIDIELKKTAIIVVDMQNAFVSRGDMLDLLKRDISSAQKIIEPCKRIIRLFRHRDEKGKIIYLQHCYASDLSNCGGEHSPNWHKELSLSFINEHPDQREASLIEGTWGSSIIDELAPDDRAICIKKQRYSGFVGTNLDLILRSYDIKFLIFMGTVINICVESTIRDAFFRNYFPILISDAAAEAGPGFIRDAALYNVEMIFGWVTDCAAFCKDLGGG